MKRTLKKLSAFVLFLAMMFQLVFIQPTVDTSAAELGDFTYDGYTLNGSNVTDKKVVVPKDTGASEIKFSENDNIESITIPEGFSSVYIFNCDNLTKVTLPSTPTYINISFCDKIESIDLSPLNSTESFICISDNSNLQSLKGPKLANRVYIDSNYALKTMDFSKASIVSSLEVNYCYKLETIKLGELTGGIYLSSLDALKKVNIPAGTNYIELRGVSYDAVTIKNNNFGYRIKNGCLYQDEQPYYSDEVVTYLRGIDSTKEKINVAAGTQVISNLNLSNGYYKVKEINFPDSVEMFDYQALEGGSNFEKITLPKNLITMHAYCLAGVKASEITIPSSVRSIDSNAFTDYAGKVKLAKSTKYLKEYEGGIYNLHFSEDDEMLSSSLVYFPKDKTSIKFMDGVTDIGGDVFCNSAIKKLDIPDTVEYPYLKFYGAKNLTSISFPATVKYLFFPVVSTAPALKTVTISEDNPYYTSYKNCIYSKDMTELLDVPLGLKTIEIPEGVLSMGYYTICNTYAYDVDKDENVIVNSPTVLFPKSLENFGSFECKLAKVYADSPIAEFIYNHNQYEKAAAKEWDYDPAPYLINYELRDSNKELLNMIYVIDQLTFGIGKNAAVVEIDMPLGLEKVSKLTTKKNTQCQVTYSSSNKKIAKVNSKTGFITGVKKGTCTINVTCTIANGKKKTSKTFKIKVKVK